jgi:hypothetical protein
MTRLVVLFLLALPLLALGCAATNPPQPRHAPFVLAEYERYAKDRLGTASVTGQAFAVTRFGAIKYAAGKTIELAPVTGYSREWYQVGVVGEKPLVASAHPEERDYIRTTVADAQGHFAFEQIPPGDYYVYTEVRYDYPCGASSCSALVKPHAEVTVGPNQTVNVIASRQDAPDGFYRPDWDSQYWWGGWGYRGGVGTGVGVRF